jgi:hypothetical protein
MCSLLTLFYLNARYVTQTLSKMSVCQHLGVVEVDVE